MAREEHPTSPSWREPAFIEDLNVPSRDLRQVSVRFYVKTYFKGTVQHPQLGMLSTYLFEGSSRTNTFYFFDEGAGSWVRMPLCWEQRLPAVKSSIDAVRAVFPHWTSSEEIVRA